MESPLEITCRVRIKLQAVDNGQKELVESYQVFELAKEIRKKWVDGLREFIDSGTNKQQIRPIDFILEPDGSVESINEELAETCVSSMVDSSTTPKAYPSRYRIPPETIKDLDNEEKVRRAELFALGGLIYEIHQGERLFEGLDDIEIQRKFRNAEFPNVTHLEQGPIILSCWSVEFARELLKLMGWFFYYYYHYPDGPPPTSLPSFTNLQKYLPVQNPARQPPGSIFHKVLQKAEEYVKAHPYIFALQVTGAAVTATSLAAPLILGAAGFGALGPIAGSSAAAWQASMGVVEAGSLFAWCQSAAMGGAAVSGIIATGATGVGVASTATVAGVFAGNPKATAQDLMDIFILVCRKG